MCLEIPGLEDTQVWNKLCDIMIQQVYKPLCLIHTCYASIRAPVAVSSDLTRPPASSYFSPVSAQEAKSAIVVRLGELLTAAGMADVHTIPRARVPVCKASHNGISFDVTVRESVCCELWGQRKYRKNNQNSDQHFRLGGVASHATEVSTLPSCASRRTSPPPPPSPAPRSTTCWPWSTPSSSRTTPPSTLG